MTTALIFLILYFAAVVLAAKLFSRNIKNLQDFFLAGRSLGAWPVALSFAASWFGAASTMGSINAFHDKGFSGAWDIVIPSVMSFVVITLFMARPVAQQSHLSQPEAVESHYGRLGRLLLALIILASTTTLIGSQMVAAGKVFQSVFGLDITLATLISTGIVVAYSMYGGYFAVVVTDIVQVLFIVVGFLILLAFTAGQAIPDAAHWAQFVSGKPDSFWSWSHHWQQNIFMAVTFVLAWCIAPEMWQRMSSTRNPDLAVRASIQATFVMMLLFGLVISIGMLSAQVIGKSDAVLVDLALKIPTPALSAMVLLGFVAAVTSTMDSSLNVSSLTLTRDIYHGFLRPQADMRELLRASRVATAIMVLPAMAIALYFQNIIQILWISADIYASCMFFPVVGMLYLKNPGRWSGVLAMIFGGLTVVLSALFQHGLLPAPAFWPIWPFSTLLGISMSGLGFGLGYGLSRRSAESADPPMPTPDESSEIVAVPEPG
ncbi:MAG TPA: sodium:solute symporter family protein [Coleofasciculaceae cyanobacterium]|jgi:SSS family solute:Na+ symporter